MAIINLHQLPARDKDLFNVVVDAPMGSRNKYKYNHKLQIFHLNKILPLGASFPYDFGFIPSTKGEDGDPIDVLVLTDEPSFVGCVLPVRLIGVIEAQQTVENKSVRNDRLLGFIETKHNPPPCSSLDELPESQLAEIEHFFISYNEVEGKQFTIIGRGGPEKAEKLFNASLIDSN
jgi:inorganic pyrophosphatase